MERRSGIKKNAILEVSPERSMVWRGRSSQSQGTSRRPSYQVSTPPRKAQVVYYICRSRQLEHPHFLEISLSSSGDLFLRDVIQRLDALRGKGMASMYSWSSKRSYKNRYVWQDLSEDDIILPTNGDEYILKGSEIFGSSSSGLSGFPRNACLKLLPEPDGSSGIHDDSPSSSITNEKDTKSSSEGDLSPDNLAEDSNRSSWNTSSRMTEYKVSNGNGLANASTQTEDAPKSQDTCSICVSMDNQITNCGHDNNLRLQAVSEKERSDVAASSASRPLSSSSGSSLGVRTDTLESLLRDDINKINSFRIFEEEDVRIPAKARLKATNILMQLISCGSISVKDHNSFGFAPTYRPRFSHSNFISPLWSTSLKVGELNGCSDDPRVMSLRLDGKQYLAAPLIESKLGNEPGNGSTIRRSFSCNGESYRDCKKMEGNSAHLKSIPLSLKESESESFRTPSFNPISSIVNADYSWDEAKTSSNCSSARISSSQKVIPSSKPQSSGEERVIKIEERISSGARVIIESKSPVEVTSCSP